MKLKMKQMKLINGKKKIKRDLKYEIKIIYIYIYIYIHIAIRNNKIFWLLLVKVFILKKLA